MSFVACLVVIALLVAPVNMAGPAGGSRAPYVESAGDTMTGDLDMGTNRILLGGAGLQGGSDGSLQYGTLGVCLESGNCALADASVLSRHLGPLAVENGHVADNAITNRNIAVGTISLDRLDTDVATQLELDALAVALATADAMALADIAWLGFAVDSAHNRINDLDVAGGGDLVHWDNLVDVPAAVTDGIASDLHCTGCVGGASLGPDGAVVSQGDLAFDSVTTAELADRAVDTAALQDGAVTPQKTTANAATAWTPWHHDLPSGNHYVGGAVLAVQGGVSHMVLVVGQFQVSCGFCDPGQPVVLDWQIVRFDETGAHDPVGPTYSTVVDPNAPGRTTGAVSWVDTPVPGTHSYWIRVTIHTPDTSLDFHDVVLNVADLGTTA